MNEKNVKIIEKATRNK